MNTYQVIAPDVKLGQNVKLSQFVNLYGCEVGDDTKIGAFVEIQKNARVGKRCKISSHTFVCEGVTIEDEVFVGHGVTFINDTYPRAATEDGQLQTEADWQVETTLIKKGASIGSGSTILSKVTVGEKAIVGAGSVVTRDVPAQRHCSGKPGAPDTRDCRHVKPEERNDAYKCHTLFGSGHGSRRAARGAAGCIRRRPGDRRIYRRTDGGGV